MAQHYRQLRFTGDAQTINRLQQNASQFPHVPIHHQITLDVEGALYRLVTDTQHGTPSIVQHQCVSPTTGDKHQNNGACPLAVSVLQCGVDDAIARPLI